VIKTLFAVTLIALSFPFFFSACVLANYLKLFWMKWKLWVIFITLLGCYFKSLLLFWRLLLILFLLVLLWRLLWRSMRSSIFNRFNRWTWMLNKWMNCSCEIASFLENIVCLTVLDWRSIRTALGTWRIIAVSTWIVSIFLDGFASTASIWWLNSFW